MRRALAIIDAKHGGLYDAFRLNKAARGKPARLIDLAPKSVELDLKRAP